MRTIITSLILGLTLTFTGPTLAEIKTQQPVQAAKLPREMICIPAAQIREVFGEQYGEMPALLGSLADSDVFDSMIITLNPDTKSWSAVLINVEQQVGCAFASGSGIELNLKVLIPGGQMVSF